MKTKSQFGISFPVQKLGLDYVRNVKMEVSRKTFIEKAWPCFVSLPYGARAH